MTPALRAAVLLALAGHLCAPAARAQRGGTEPLRKVELVRLLGSRAISTTEVAGLVRRNCVAFRPSERDRADLRAAGADDAVLAAIHPQLIIIADSKSPATRHASRALRERLEKHGVPVLFTSELGAVKISLRKNQWKVETVDGPSWSGTPKF